MTKLSKQYQDRESKNRYQKKVPEWLKQIT